MLETAFTLLVAASLDARERSFYQELIGRAERIVAVDAGLAACRWSSRAPDVLIGDLDSVDEGDLRWLDDHDATVITAETRKDQTDLELALAHVEPDQRHPLAVTGILGGRLDHELAALSALFRSSHDRIVVREPTVGAWALGAPTTLHVEGSIGATISLLGWGPGCAVTTSGLEYPLKHAALDHLEPRGVSNTLVAENASIDLLEGQLLVVMPVLDFPRPIGYATASPGR